MEYELSSLLELIKEKTGKDVFIYSELDGKHFSTKSVPIERAEFKVTGIVPDSNKRKTYFRFISGGENLIGYIDGDTEAEKVVCGLIVALLENGVVKESRDINSETLKSIVSGEEKTENIKKYIAKYRVPENPCMVFAVFADDKKISDVLTFVENFKTQSKDLVVKTEDGIVAYVKFSDIADAESEQSIAEYASLMSESVFEELGVKTKIGVGSKVADFKECAISYKQAVSAVKMGELFSPTSTVFTYKEYVLIKIFEDLPKYRVKEYLDIMLESEAKEIFDDEEMIITAEEFFNNNLNASETARKLFMHRNTLTYRLDKINKTTGLDIRKFSDAVTFKIMTILYKLTQNKDE